MTSHEVFDLSSGIRINLDDKTFSHFQRDQLFLSIYKSCKHRPDALNEASGLTQTIIAELLQNYLENGKLTRSAIIEAASKVLQRFDPSAAAIYRAYHN